MPCVQGGLAHLYANAKISLFACILLHSHRQGTFIMLFSHMLLSHFLSYAKMKYEEENYK